MTEQEAVEYWKEQKYIGRNAPNDYCNAVDCAIKALEEISLYKQGGLCLIPTDVFERQCVLLDEYKELGTARQVQDFIADWRKYRALGTVEELRVARDKQVAKKVIPRHIRKYDGFDDGECPTCGNSVLRDGFSNDVYCDECGQKLDWSVEDDLRSI